MGRSAKEREIVGLRQAVRFEYKLSPERHCLTSLVKTLEFEYRPRFILPRLDCVAAIACRASVTARESAR